MKESKVIKKINKYLACKLTDEELRAKSDELAQTVQDTANEETRQTDLKSQMKAKMTELQSRQTQLASHISRREEYRDVQVEIILVGDGKVKEVRTDTGEVLITRPGREDELQMVLSEKLADGDRT